jgi:hypothetical protein
MKILGALISLLSLTLLALGQGVIGPKGLPVSSRLQTFASARLPNRRIEHGVVQG